MIGREQEVKLEDVVISTPKIESKQSSDFSKLGVVKFFNHDKGFGFIKENDSSNEYFVHSENLIDQITERDKVKFELGAGQKGPIAINVKLIAD